MKKSEMQSTDARVEDGLPRNSVDASVMDAERSAVGAENVYVATEDQRIAEVVKNAGFQSVMTTDDALTGTDRLAQAAKQVKADIY